MGEYKKPWLTFEEQADLLIDDLFVEETKRCAAELAKKLKRGYEERGE